MNPRNNALVFVLSLFIFFSIIITIIFYSNSIKAINDASKDSLLNTLESNAKAIENLLYSNEMVTNALASIIETSLPSYLEDNSELSVSDYKSSISYLFLNTIKIFDVRSGWVYFNSDTTKPLGSLAYRKEGKAYYSQYDNTMLTSGFNKYSWLAELSLANNSWSRPYYWEPWNETLISNFKKIQINGKSYGLVGSDVFLKDITSILNNMQLFHSSRIILVNNENTILYDTIPENKGKNYLEIENANSISLYNKSKTGKQTEYYQVEDQQIQHIFAYSRLSNHWVLITQSSKYEAYQNLHSLNFILLVIFITLVSLIQFYFYYIEKSNHSGEKNEKNAFTNYEQK